MKTLEIWCGSPATQAHAVEIDGRVVAAFWRLGNALRSGAARDRELFQLGRCIGSTPGTTAMLHAFGERDDPATFPMSRLVHGGDQPMLDAYWQTAEDPVVFQLARRVHELSTEQPDERRGAGQEFGGELVFDVSGDHARLAGIRFSVR